MRLIGRIKRRAEKESYKGLLPMRNRHVIRMLRGTPVVRGDHGRAVEVHTLCCRSHVGICIVGLKSLLRHGVEAQVVIHDDGSLRGYDIELIRHHVQGARVITKSEADEIVGPAIGSDSILRRVRDVYPNIAQVIDYFLCADVGKIISMDSDCLFFDRPTEVLRWISNDTDEILYNYEPGTEARPMRRENLQLFEDMSNSISLNSGFVCMHRDIMGLDFLQSFVERITMLPHIVAGGREELSCTAQTALAVFCLRSRYSVKKLSADRYKVLCSRSHNEAPMLFRETAVFRHYNYWRKRFRKEYGYMRDIGAVLNEMSALVQSGDDGI